MKNATKHAETLKSLMKSMLKEGKPRPIEKLDPVRALVRGALVFDLPESRAEEALAAIEREFININEIRVATQLELQDLIGSRYPGIEKRVEIIILGLNGIFEKEHTLSLDRLRTLNKRDIRQFVRDLPAMTPFVEAYIMLFGFEISAAPVDDVTLNFLREEDAIEETATIEEAQKFLEHNLKAEECFDFYALVRRAIFETTKGKKKAAKA